MSRPLSTTRTARSSASSLTHDLEHVGSPDSPGVGGGGVMMDEVAGEISQAMATLRYMPGENTGRLHAVWPETLNTDRENWWAAPNATNINRYQPTPQDIARMDMVIFEWLPLLTDYERVLVSARGAGWSWAKIMRTKRNKLGPAGNHHETHRRLHKRALAKLAAKVAQKCFVRGQGVAVAG